MNRGLLVVLWALAGIAALGTLLGVLAFASMCGWMTGGMMPSRTMSCGRMSGPMVSGGRGPMMLEALATWVTMLGLTGVFVYLVAAALRQSP